MAKHTETKSTEPTPGSLAHAQRTTFSRRRVEMPVFETAQEERAWMKAQEQRERELEDARRKYPPGTTLLVTTARGIARRGRAGVSFSDKGRTTVEVVDLEDDQLARIRSLSQADIEKLHAGEELEGLDGVDAKLAAKAASGTVVTPMGAKAIAEDDGLQVWTEGGKDAPAADSPDAEALKSENDALRAENKSLRDQVARLKGESRKGSGGPERLASSSSEFGGDEGKSKG